MSNREKVARYRVDYCDEFDGAHFSQCYNTEEEAIKACSRFNSQEMSSSHVVDVMVEEKKHCENKFREKVKSITDDFIQKKIYNIDTYTTKIKNKAEKLNVEVEQIYEKYDNDVKEPPKKKPRTK